jgi:hypothetical protein
LAGAAIEHASFDHMEGLNRPEVRNSGGALRGLGFPPGRCGWVVEWSNQRHTHEIFFKARVSQTPSTAMQKVPCSRDVLGTRLGRASENFHPALEVSVSEWQYGFIHREIQINRLRKIEDNNECGQWV